MAQGRDGDCSYERKANLAKEIGAVGIIIIDSTKGVNNLKVNGNRKLNVYLMEEADGDKMIEKYFKDGLSSAVLSIEKVNNTKSAL